MTREELLDLVVDNGKRIARIEERVRLLFQIVGVIGAGAAGAVARYVLPKIEHIVDLLSRSNLP